MKSIVVSAASDDEAQVWVADSADVPGLCTEAVTLEVLTAKLEVMIPELLETGLSAWLEHWRYQTQDVVYRPNHCRGAPPPYATAPIFAVARV
jgi:hypothetical protein